jgi:hypothetical protein
VSVVLWLRGKSHANTEDEEVNREHREINGDVEGETDGGEEAVHKIGATG